MFSPLFIFFQRITIIGSSNANMAIQPKKFAHARQENAPPITWIISHADRKRAVKFNIVLISVTFRCQE